MKSDAVQRKMCETIRRIGGIILLTLRAAFRTRIVMALLLLLSACILFLPRILKGDGTPEGDLQILITYTLGFAFSLLCLATLWSACSLFASELDNARMQLSLVKPVSMVVFWAGKWLSLLALNAILLCLVYAGVYAQIQWHILHRNWGVTQRPMSRYVSRPILPTPHEEALATYARLKAQRQIPAGISESQMLKVLNKKALEKYDVINPGDQTTWRFCLTRPLTADERVTVRMTFDTEFSTRAHVKGVCLLRNLDSPAKEVEVILDDFTRNEIEFTVVARELGVAANTTLHALELTFRHAGEARHSAGLMLRFRQDISVLTPGGSFEANLVRAALTHWSVLAMLAAFGLTVSACFSLPVSAFTATALLMLTLIGNSVVQVVSETNECEWKNRAGIWISRGVYEITRQAMNATPLTALTRGEIIDYHLLSNALLWNGITMPFIFALFSCWVLKNRELADIA